MNKFYDKIVVFNLIAYWAVLIFYGFLIYDNRAIARDNAEAVKNNTEVMGDLVGKNIRQNDTIIRNQYIIIANQETIKDILTKTK